jgi:hypothetical protein
LSAPFLANSLSALIANIRKSKLMTYMMNKAELSSFCV